MKNKLISLIDQTLILFVQGVFFLTPLYFSFFYRDFSVFSLDKTALFKILTGILLVILLIKLLMTKELDAARLKSALVYLPFFLILAISTIFSLDAHNSLAGSYWRQQGFITYLYYLSFVAILLIAITEKRQINKIINALLFSSLLVSLYGIYQWLGLDSFSWAKPAAAGGRVISTFGQPVFLGNYLLLVIFLSVYKFVVADSLLKRFLFALLFAVQFLCLVFTYTRGAWLGFAAGLMVVLFVIVRTYKLKKVLIFSAIGLSLFLLFLMNFNNFFTYRVKSMADFGSGSLALRLKYWQAGLKATAARPLTGVGLENEQQAILKYYDPSWSVFETIGSSPDRVHNELMDLGLQGGIFLVLSYLLILFYLFYKAVKILPRLEKQDGWLLIALLTGVFSYQVALLSSFSTIDTSPIFWALTALILIIAKERNNRPRFEWSKKANYGLAALTVLAVLVSARLIHREIAKVRADYNFRLARIAYAQEDYLAMVNRYLQVFALNAEERFYGWFFANDLEAALEKIDEPGLRNGILIYLKNYLANNQSNTENYAELFKKAKMLTMLGYYDQRDYFQKAEKIYEQLIAFNPFIFDSYKAWAKNSVYSGDCPRALALYEQALAILPLDSPKLNEEHLQETKQAASETYKNMAYCYKELGQSGEEIAVYEKILKLDPYRPDIYDLLARSRYRLGNIDKAIWYNRRGLSLDAKNYHWPWVLSLLYREKKDMAMAKKYLAEALKLAPENEELKKYERELNKK